jgi:threonine dehydratase
MMMKYSHLWNEPQKDDFKKAQKIVSKYLVRTPFLKAPRLSKILGMEAYIKCENLQITGSFKVRGGVNLMASLSLREKRHGVITASTGNHGQSIAYAASLFNVHAIIAVPKNANPLKVDAIQRLGGTVVFHGKDFDDAKIWVEEEAKRHHYRYINSGNETSLITGVGSLYLEMLEDTPDIDTFIVPVGGGSGVSAACMVATYFAPDIEVIGVQSEKAPAVYRSWKTKQWVETDTANTFAEGLATRAPFALPLQIMRRRLDDFILVNEDQIKQAILLLFEATHQVVEGAGAASTAAAMMLKKWLKGKKVGLVLSGGNLTLEQFRALIC